MGDFEGFPKKTLTFLRGLQRNNTKEWFTEHRRDYDRYWVEPAKDFVVAAGEALQKLAPVTYEPKINGSIFRINRDIRFSQDKRPYKDHLDFWFWEGVRKSAVSGFFLRVTPNQIGIGVGAHGFDKDRLVAYRDAVVADGAAASLAAAVKKVERAGYGVKGERYKRVPRGYEPANDTQERLLRFSALWCGEDVKHPPELHTSKFVNLAVREWRKLVPLHRWLVDELGVV
jgi:uncharacterized protein (TIGR02453 family)